MSDSSPTLRPQPDEETIAFAGRVFQLARDGGAEQMRSLLAQGLPPNLRNDKGDTLLMLAAYHLRTDTVRALLEGGANPEIANDRGQTPLAAAAFKGAMPVVLALLDGGAAIDGAGFQRMGERESVRPDGSIRRSITPVTPCGSSVPIKAGNTASIDSSGSRRSGLVR